MRMVRIYNDAEGASHFEEAEVPLTTVKYGPQQVPAGFSPSAAASQYRFMRLPAGVDFGWHPSAGRGLIIFLAGEIEVEVSDGAVRRFRAGDVVLAEDTTGTGHDSRSVGGEDALMALITLSG